jgi:NAD(P)-dependent dehydrogenase (short-subunit alcohol dehydrogenase family)
MGRLRARRTFLVTGATRNLGRACALALAARGANVVVGAFTHLQAADAVARECAVLGVEARALRIDVADEASVQAAVAEGIATFGRIDGYVANAAIRPSENVTGITPEEWERVLAVDLTSSFHLARAVAPMLIENGWGRIVHTSGLSAWRPHPGRAHVVAAKAALHGLTKGLAMELGSTGITVNTVVPGNFAVARDDPALHAQLEAIAASAPARRLGRPEEYGALCAFLMSEDAGYITGQAIHLSGGLHME